MSQEQDSIIDMPELTSDEVTIVNASALALDRLAGRPLGEILIALGQITGDDLNDALDEQREKKDGRIGEILVAMKKVDEEKVARALALQLDMPFYPKIDIDKIPDELVQSVPIAFAKQNNVLPMYPMGDTIVAVIADPVSTSALDDLALLLKSRLVPVIALAPVITDAINRVYDRATGLAHEAVQRLQTDEDDEGADIDAIDLIDEHGG